MKYSTQVIAVEHVTHDTLGLTLHKPQGYSYSPGQATDLAIQKPGWETEWRPFTFTSLPEEDRLEFTIKTYPEHGGVTNQLLQIRPGDEIILHEVFGDIGYKGPGVFIAGGAGITPFIAIFKDLQKRNLLPGNTLIFANKSRADIIHESNFKAMLGNRFINILSEEKLPDYAHGFITPSFLKQYLNATNDYVYLCGPDPMMNALDQQLQQLGVPPDKIVKEGF